MKEFDTSWAKKGGRRKKRRDEAGVERGNEGQGWIMEDRESWRREGGTRKNRWEGVER